MSQPPNQRPDDRTDHEELDAETVTEDAIEFFSTDEDEPSAADPDPDGPPPPNA